MNPGSTVEIGKRRGILLRVDSDGIAAVEFTTGGSYSIEYFALSDLTQVQP